MKTTVILEPFDAFSDGKTCLLGIDALIALEAIICKLFYARGCAAEPMAEYGSEELKERREAEELLEIVRQASDRLRELGISEEKIKECCRTGSEKPPERIRITKWYRILLPDRGNVEVKMRPLAKTLFILFLRHPEGIVFKALSDYRKEIYEIYGRVSGRTDLQAMSRSLEKLMDPCDNAINISRSRVSSALGEYFEGSRLGQYLISGSAGAPKAIALDRSYVTWDAPIQ